MIIKTICNFSKRFQVSCLEFCIENFFVTEIFCADANDCLPSEECTLNSPSERAISTGNI